MTPSLNTDLETFILDVRERAVSARAPIAVIAKLDDVLDYFESADADKDRIAELKADLEEARDEIDSLNAELEKIKE